MTDERAPDSENAALMREIEKAIPPMDIGDAGRLLREAKQIFDDHGVVFFLRQGTALGAIRDGALIPWDDDLDLGSIIGMHGFDEPQIAPVVEAFRAIDCYVEVHPEGLYTSVKIMKYRIRIDWQCYRVLKGTIAHYPGVPFPIRLFERFEDATIDGVTYRVPSPSDDYLQLKYGPGWRTPKQAGYEKDVLDAMPSGEIPGRAGRLQRFVLAHLVPGRATRLLVLDREGRAVPGARVRVAGLGGATTNRRGIARFYIPTADDYALVIAWNGFEEVLYEEELTPGRTYVYSPDAEKTVGRYYALTEQSSAGTRTA
ncbi:MAG: LicD family protein [Chloroflexi bacterium]|nr:LicD family protein [Chloroflexota bacterium]